MRWTKIRRSRLSCCDFATSIFVSIFYASHAALVASPYGQQRRRQRWSIFISGGRASGAVPRESRLTDRAVSGQGPRLTDRRRPVMTVSRLTLFVVTDRPSRRRRRIRARQAGRQAGTASRPAVLPGCRDRRRQSIGRRHRLRCKSTLVASAAAAAAAAGFACYRMIYTPSKS